MSRTKVLWHSNAPFAPTGYGNQTGLFTPYLNEHYDVAVSAFYGLQGAPIRWNDIPVLPGFGPDFGGEYLGDHAARYFDGDRTNGIVFTLMDVWVLPPQLGGQLNLVAWTPIDHDPVTTRVLSFFATGAIPLAMSRFGWQQLKDALALDQDPLYCPHAVDTEALRPYPREEARKLMGLPNDAFLVGMVAANKGRPSRKGFQQAFEAFKLFRDSHPDARLYLHTSADPNLADGENLIGLLKALDIPSDVIGWADQYRINFAPYPSQAMALIYSGMDVLLNPAMGEGFGIPVLEAQSCGIPVIVTDFSAMPEVGGVGWHVSHRRHWSGHNSWQALADPEDIHEALKHCYSLSAAGRQALGEKARAHALNYDVRKVMEEHMLPALREAERRFDDRRPVEVKRALKAAA